MWRVQVLFAGWLITRSVAAAPCGDFDVPIHEIQGDGASSTLTGMELTAEAVVTASFPELDGYFVQEPAASADGDPRTSDGLFVHQPGAAVVPGELLRVTGTVTEFHELTELTQVTQMVRCGAAAVPAATDLALPVAADTAFEAVEGMLLRLRGPLVVVDTYELARYGEVDLAPERLFQPTALASPGAEAKALSTAQRWSRVQLDDGRGTVYPEPIPYVGPDGTLRGGDRTTDVIGVLGFGHGQYELHPTSSVTFQRANPRQVKPPDPGGSLRVASFNVYNYFTTLDSGASVCGPEGTLDCRGARNADERRRQRDKLLAALGALDADIVALLEVENDAGATLAELVQGLGGYDFVRTGTIGSDAIRVALLFRPSTVTTVGDFALLDGSVDSRFLDTLNRPVLAQSFESVVARERFTVVVNHLKSKGSPCDAVGDPDTGDGQGNCNRTRLAAVAAELDWLAADPTGSGDPDVLVLGDFNAYSQEEPVRAFVASGFEKLTSEGTYSYLFDGGLGSLDHAFASPSLANRVMGCTVWHINADEPRFLDYHSSNPAGAYEPGPFRSSDHDPVLVGLFERAATKPKEVATAVQVANTSAPQIIRLGKEADEEEVSSSSRRQPSGCVVATGALPTPATPLFCLAVLVGARRRRYAFNARPR